MSTPEKVAKGERKKESPTSVTEGPGAGVDPLTILGRILDDHPEIHFSEEDPGIFFAWDEYLLVAILQVAEMQLDSPFLAGQPPPQDKEELAMRVVDYCRDGAGTNLHNGLVYNLTVIQFGYCLDALAELRHDPYIQTLRATFGQPIMRYYMLPSREQVSPPLEL